jgi:hypothetical protein
MPHAMPQCTPRYIKNVACVAPSHETHAPNLYTSSINPHYLSSTGGNF